MKINILYILLFFSTAVFAQKNIPNLTSISLHKIYNIPSDAPCNSFTNSEGASVTSRKIVDCDNLVLELIHFKKILKSVKSENICCSKRAIGCPEIENMIVYQFNKLVDTIYFNSDYKESIIYDFQTEKEYFDKKNELHNILVKNKVIKDFYKLDLERLFQNIYNNETDTIDVDDIKVNDTKIYGLNKEDFEKNIGNYESINISQEKYNNWSKNTTYITFSNNSGNEFYFFEDNPIHCFSIEHIEMNDEYQNRKSLDVLGFMVGDDEIKLFQKFPNSAKGIDIVKQYFKDENGDYSIRIKINNDKGRVDFTLNNSKIKKIAVNFRY
ncbi:MAG TPA: hypothetical protein PLP39_08085 [Flavobacterium lutivivi]|nr:hypothetical protein [Flavobacterium lutivivi]